MRLSAQALAVLFVAGAVVLTLLDSIHVHTGTLVYEHPFVLGSAFWVPLLMGGAVAGGGVAFVRGYDRLGGPPSTPSNVALALAALVFAALYAASGLLPVGPVVMLVLLTAGAAGIFWAIDGTRAGAVLMLLGAILGPVAEAISVEGARPRGSGGGWL